MKVKQDQLEIKEKPNKRLHMSSQGWFYFRSIIFTSNNHD